MNWDIVAPLLVLGVGTAIFGVGMWVHRDRRRPVVACSRRVTWRTSSVNAPVRRQPRKRRRIGRAQTQDSGRHGQQRMQIERAGLAPSDQRRRASLARLDPLAKLPCQDPASRHRQVSVTRRLGRRADENVVFDGGKFSCQGITPDPRAAAVKPPTVSAGPLIVRW